jgi:hypothetical protein
MRHLVVLYVTRMRKGQVVKVQDLYSLVFKFFTVECHSLGFTDSHPIEPKWKNEVRYGLWEARKKSLIKHVGTPKSGRWRRLQIQNSPLPLLCPDPSSDFDASCAESRERSRVGVH